MSLVQLIAVAASLAGPASALLSNSSLNSQVRCAFHGDDGLTITWSTLNKLDKPVVKYGKGAHSLTSTSSPGTSTTYQSSVTWDNYVLLTGLDPDTVYYYAPDHLLRGDASDDGDVPPFQCKTAKPAGKWEPYSVAFVADMGAFGPYGLSTSAGKGVSPDTLLKQGEHTTIQSMRESADSFDFVVHGGDFTYADAWYKEEKGGYLPETPNSDGWKVYNSIENAFYDELMQISSQKAYMVCAGNHESNCVDGGSPGLQVCPPGQRNFTGYLNHWNMPSDVSGGYEALWYSFDYGSVHYLIFNTETNLGNGIVGPDEAPNSNESGPFGPENDQVDFIHKDLSSVDRCKTPWVVAIGHRPWLVSEPCQNCSLAFAPLLEQYGVDVVLQGHDHVYQRNVPVYVNGTIDPAGYNNPSSPLYIINGVGGHYDGLNAFGKTLPYQAFGLDIYNSTYGWSRIHFYNETHLEHEFVASNNNTVLDSIFLVKDRKSCPIPSSSSTAKPTPTPTPTVSSSSGSGSGVQWTTSVVRTTELITVTSCAATITNCPARSTRVITSTRDLYTTVCPVTEAQKTATGESAATSAATSGITGSGSGSGSSGPGSVSASWTPVSSGSSSSPIPTQGSQPTTTPVGTAGSSKLGASEALAAGTFVIVAFLL